MPSTNAYWESRWLEDIAAGVVDDPRPGRLTARFEETLRRALPLRAVELAPVPEGTLVRDGALDGTRVCLRVATTRGRYVLRARFRPGYGTDESSMSRLRLAASLGTLVVELERARTRPNRARRFGSETDADPIMIGSSEPMRSLIRLIDRVAPHDYTVMVEGESGVGKELVARRIHARSERHGGPFVAVNCAALVDTLLEAELFGIEDRTATGVRGRRGKFEAADGGTLFLDEVSDLSRAAQAKLLRAIQELAVERVGGLSTQRVDVRIIVATNRRLAGLVANGQFREDLFHRLNGIEVVVPPLRARPGDIAPIARAWLDRQTTVAYRMSAEALDALTAYHWPGNVRELERVLERAVTLAEGGEIRLADLPAALRGPYTERLWPSLARPDDLRTWAGRYVRLVLGRQGGNKRAACRRLGISYHTLQAYLRRAEGGTPPTSRQPVARPLAVAEPTPPDWTGSRRGRGP